MFYTRGVFFYQQNAKYGRRIDVKMKWPKYLLLMRHDTSAYNALKGQKKKSSLYQEFLEQHARYPLSDRTKELALAVKEEFCLGTGDHNTPLLDPESPNAQAVGKALSHEQELPDVVLVSPHVRTKSTLKGLQKGWGGLADVETIEEPRVREQEHGLALIYNDWNVFTTFHPEQQELRDIEGPYWYRFPQGESASDVRERDLSLKTTLIRTYHGKKVLIVTHHLNILAQMANFGRWSEEKYIDVDTNDKPINCGVTLYRGNPNKGSKGVLELKYYNRKFY